jgi:hypothetical protein
LIPAGGQAMRIAPLPCSKELCPVGLQPIGENDTLRPIEGIIFSDDSCLDIGTIEDLVKAVRNNAHF